MPALSVRLVRHGESTANVGLPSPDFDSIALTPRGQEQAMTLAASLLEPPDLLVISPLKRAIQTAEPIRARWPQVACETWPIQEITYLSPQRCAHTTPVQRRQWVQEYWERCDVDSLDGPDAESFAQFWTRVAQFHERAVAQRSGRILVVGHGQFLHASLMYRPESAVATPVLMRRFRHTEVAHPLANACLVDMPLHINAPSGE